MTTFHRPGAALGGGSSILFTGQPVLPYADAPAVRTAIEVYSTAEMTSILAGYSPTSHTHALTDAAITGVLPDTKGGPAGTTNFLPVKTAGGLWANSILYQGSVASNKLQIDSTGSATTLSASERLVLGTVVNGISAYCQGGRFGNVSGPIAPLDFRATTGNIAWFGYDAANGLGVSSTLAGRITLTATENTSFLQLGVVAKLYGANLELNAGSTNTWKAQMGSAQFVGAFSTRVEVGDATKWLRFFGTTLGFFGTDGVARSTGWTIPTTYTSRKTFSSTATVTLAELADVVATLIAAHHQTAGYGLLGT